MGLLNKLKKKNDTNGLNQNGFISIEVKPLIEWNEPNGEGCIVSDKITKEGWKVGYMFRTEPLAGQPDSGWRFFKGDEDSEYMDDSNNHHVFSLNTICNYDNDIIPYLKMEIGTYLIRVSDNEFMIDNQDQPIYFMKQEYNNYLSN